MISREMGVLNFQKTVAGLQKIHKCPGPIVVKRRPHICFLTRLTRSLQTCL